MIYKKLLEVAVGFVVVVGTAAVILLTILGLAFLLLNMVSQYK